MEAILQLLENVASVNLANLIVVCITLIAVVYLLIAVKKNGKK